MDTYGSDIKIIAKIENQEGVDNIDEHLADGGVVLAGEDFRRGHHAGLEAVVHREQHRHQRHEGLAAAHVTLENPIHGFVILHIP